MQPKSSLVVDIDGTLCPIKESHQSYEDLTPFPQIVQKLYDYKALGFEIVLYTARNMRTYDGNLGLINVHTARMTLDWLDHHKIPYDQIFFGKPWPGPNGFYIDDRTVRPREFLDYDQKTLERIMTQDRLEASSKTPCELNKV